MIKLWNYDQHLKKVIVWRSIALLISGLLLYLYLGTVWASIELTIIEAIIATLAHYLFENIWNKKIHALPLTESSSDLFLGELSISGAHGVTGSLSITGSLSLSGSEPFTSLGDATIDYDTFQELDLNISTGSLKFIGKN